MLDTGKPIRIFLGNLLYLGVALRVANGKLQVFDPRGVLSPVYQDEIIRRAEQLIVLLSAPVPDALEPYSRRLLRVADVEAAQTIANQMGIELRATPANGGWLVDVEKAQEEL